MVYFKIKTFYFSNLNWPALQKVLIQCEPFKTIKRGIAFATICAIF